MRSDIARLEGRMSEAEKLSLDGAPADAKGTMAAGPAAARLASDRLSLGVPELDTLLQGGLARAALHEIRTAETRDASAAAGFVLALLASAREGEKAAPGTVLWVSSAESRRETGTLYGPGLAAMGLDPARIVWVEAARPVDAVWAFEAGLACKGLSFAVCELRRAACLDLTATRRAALRARETGVTGFLLRVASPAEPSAAETRWRLSARPAGQIGALANGVGRTAWRLDLEKNRLGRTGAFIVEWNGHERRFATRSLAEDFSGLALPIDRSVGSLARSDAAANPLPLAAASADGSAAAAGAERPGVLFRARPGGWKRAS
ncbi:ImuA family protein [Faunimonas pinastri]|uniref:ImuA family protein n=1 Tax=Faunimonas pinastri TaxID=1855383 RepID=UPI001EEC9BCE|nr:hypothetical protein [Faunimonas pinastri]